MRAQVAQESSAHARAHAHTLANLALSREAKENARPAAAAAAHVCRTGSVSIRPDPCGLLYSPQVLSFLPSFPRHAALVVYRLARSFFRSAVLAAERAVSLSFARESTPIFNFNVPRVRPPPLCSLRFIAPVLNTPHGFLITEESRERVLSDRVFKYRPLIVRSTIMDHLSGRGRKSIGNVKMIYYRSIFLDVSSTAGQ